MERFELNGHEVVDGDVRATGNGAHVYVPRRWLGADVKIVRVSEPDHNDESTTNYNYRYRLRPSDALAERLAWTVDTCR